MTAEVVGCPACGTRNRVPVAATGRPRCASCHTDLPWIVDAGDEDFGRAVDAGGLVIVDLWAPWCGPCKMVAPVLATLAQEFAGSVKVVKVNVDDAVSTARRYEARSIPMLLFMRRGDVIDTVVGAQPEHALRALVQRHT